MFGSRNRLTVEVKIARRVAAILPKRPRVDKPERFKRSWASGYVARSPTWSPDSIASEVGKVQHFAAGHPSAKTPDRCAWGGSSLGRDFVLTGRLHCRRRQAADPARKSDRAGPRHQADRNSGHQGFHVSPEHAARRRCERDGTRDRSVGILALTGDGG